MLGVLREKHYCFVFFIMPDVMMAVWQYKVLYISSLAID